MRIYLTLIVLAGLLFGGLSAAVARDEDEAGAALALAQAARRTVELASEPLATGPHPCTCGCVETGNCKCPNCNVGCGFPVPAKKQIGAVLDYAAGLALAERTGRPLVVWVGQAPVPAACPVPGAIHARAERLEGCAGRCVVVAQRLDGAVRKLLEVEAVPSVAEVQEALRPQEDAAVRRSFVPVAVAPPMVAEVRVQRVAACGH